MKSHVLNAWGRRRGLPKESFSSLNLTEKGILGLFKLRQDPRIYAYKSLSHPPQYITQIFDQSSAKSHGLEGFFLLNNFLSTTINQPRS